MRICIDLSVSDAKDFVQVACGPDTDYNDTVRIEANKSEEFEGLWIVTRLIRWNPRSEWQIIRSLDDLVEEMLHEAYRLYKEEM